MKRTTLCISFTVLLSIVLAACSFGKVTPFPTPTMKAAASTATSTLEPPATLPAADPVTILSSNMYTDGFGDVHVAALVMNTSSQALQNVTLSIEIRDAAGKSLILDDNKNPVESTEVQTLLGVLAPQAASPLDYYITPEAGSVPASFKVTYVSSDPAEASFVSLSLENTHFTHDDYGVYYIFGEFVNKGSLPVKIDGLAGTLVDSSDKIVAANSTMNMVEYLAPSGDPGGLDRAPFGIAIYGQKDAGSQYGWHVYPDAGPSEALSTRNVQLLIASSYIDSLGEVHIVGAVKHTDPSQLTFPIQAMVTDKNGAVLDTYFTMLPFNLDSGYAYAFDFSYWQQINSNNADKQNIANVYLQTDPSWIWETNETYLSGTTENVILTDLGEGQVHITGSAINSTGKVLKEAIVWIVFFDSGNNITGAGYQSLYPSGETFAVSEKIPFDFYVYLNPNQEYSKFDHEVDVVAVQANQ